MKADSERGKLGLPLSNIESNNLMKWQKYQNGYIVGSDKTGYYVSMGAIRDVWESTGFESGRLGLPISEPTMIGTTEMQSYQYGEITCNKNNCAFTQK